MRVIGRGAGLFGIKFGTICRISPGGDYSGGADYELSTPQGVSALPRRVIADCPYTKHFVAAKGNPADWHRRSANFEGAYDSGDRGISMADFKSPTKAPPRA